MKAVIYTRVSTDVQVDTGHSLDMQRDRLESYCKAYNLEIADVLVDEGISGGIPLHKRPEGSKLVEMARKKEKIAGSLLITEKVVSMILLPTL